MPADMPAAMLVAPAITQGIEDIVFDDLAKTSTADHTLRGVRGRGLSSSDSGPIILPCIKPSGLFWSDTLKNSSETSDTLSTNVGATEVADAAETAAVEAAEAVLSLRSNAVLDALLVGRMIRGSRLRLRLRGRAGDASA